MSQNSTDDLYALFRHQARWRIIDELLSTDPAEGLKRDSCLLKEVTRAKRGATVRLWENPQCLVVPRKATRFPEFESACQQLAEEGWPVIVRESGGTTVPHHPGILNFSLFFPQLKQPHFDLDTVYMALCEPLRMAMDRLGLIAEYGETEGSYCDGRYNLNIEGLKVTGTAQKIMLSPENSKGVTHGVLAQAMLMVDADAQEGTHWVNRFYELAGNPRRFDPQVSTSLSHLVRQQGLKDIPDDLTLHLRQLIIQAVKQLASNNP